MALRSSIVALCLLVLGPAARAQQPSPGETTREDRERALDLFQQSAEHYEEGRYGVAAELLREAWELHHEPLLLYNLGRALDGMGDAEGAVEAYRDYLEHAPGAEDRAVVEQRIGALSEQIEADSRPAPTPREPEGYRGAGPYPYVVAGAGVLGAGVAVGLWTAAAERQRDAEQDPVHESAARRAESAESLATAGNVLAVVGGVLLAAGATWIAVDLLVVEPGEAAVSVGPRGVLLRGRF